MQKITLSLMLPLVSTALVTISAQQNKQPNILFISIDDLRPELGCYGKDYIKSPYIDSFASQSVLFERAYCNIPVSGATRASIMTGLYPNRTRFLDYKTYIDKDTPNALTLPQYFKEKGYHTISIGKTIHHLEDALRSWSTYPWRPDYPNEIYTQENWRDYQSLENGWTVEQGRAGKVGPAWEKANVPDSAYYDGKTTEKVIQELKKLVKSDTPFFMAMGLLKPHLPFNAPAKYWDMYKNEDIELAPNPFFPENAPKEAEFNSDETRSYINIPKQDTLINEYTSRMLKHGYFACVSYVDAQIGKVLQVLKETGLSNNTIVVLWGDHGWSLGEHNHWGKHTCFSNSLQSPLIIKTPGIKPSETKALVSFVDVFPTLCDLAKLEIPEHLQGKSMLKILKKPTRKGGVVFSRYPNGETIVTQRYVYTEYIDNKTKQYVSRMLYDHKLDPLENINGSENSKYASVVKNLSKRLRKHIEKVKER